MQLDKDLMMAKRVQQPLSLVVLDLDRFKHLNDTAGHDAGDAAFVSWLIVFARKCAALIGALVLVVTSLRLILPHARADGAMLVAERLRVAD